MLFIKSNILDNFSIINHYRPDKYTGITTCLRNYSPIKYVGPVGDWGSW